ncbi:hypothetical protein BVC71_04065 [Marivivens niveibacter]|uniref:Uncharacterized protein n=1 Tax=Marivivens niveibacter TaxID=1930667 RepID=A0A251X267_9RHOB|nr:hypothetical protein BVC71_04065 [Marivivens niveibacter]
MFENFKSFAKPDTDHRPVSARQKPADLTRLELAQPQSCEKDNKRLSSALSRINSLLSPN